MEKFNGYTFGIIFPLVIIIVILVLSLNFTKDNFLNKTTKLETLEIRNYEGKDLSSIYDFRENSIKGPQEINNYNLKVTGLVEEEKSYSYDEIINRKSYSKVITLHCVEGWSATILWEGIILRDLLKEAKPKPEANTIIFHAYDGYTTSYPIEYIMNQDIILIQEILMKVF